MFVRSMAILGLTLIVGACGKAPVFLGSVQANSMCINYTASGEYNASKVDDAKQAIKAMAGKNWSENKCSTSGAKGMCAMSQTRNGAVVEMEMYGYDANTAASLKAACSAGTYSSL